MKRVDGCEQKHQDLDCESDVSDTFRVVNAVFIEPEHDRMKNIERYHNDLEPEKRPSGIPEHLVENIPSFKIVDYILRPQKHRGGHCHEIERRVDEQVAPVTTKKPGDDT